MNFDTDPRGLSRRRFPLGRLVATPAAIERMEAQHIKPGDLLRRHQSGDWGDLSEDDKRENEYSVDRHLRIFSSYGTGDRKLWVITEADRSATTILTPEDY